MHAQPPGVTAPSQPTSRVGDASRRPTAPAGPDRSGPVPGSRTDADDLPRAAVDSVLRRLPALTDRVLGTILEQEPAYRDGGPRLESLRTTLSGTLRAGLLAIPSPGEYLETASQVSWQIGRERALRGLSVETVLSSYRIGSMMLWHSLMEAAAELDPRGIPALISRAQDAWDFHLRQCAAVTEGHRSVVGEVVHRHDEHAAAILDTLLDDGIEDAEIPFAAALLDLPEQGRYAVVVLRGPDPVSRRTLADLTFGGMRIVWRPRREGPIATVLLGSATTTDLATAAAPPPGVRAGVSPAVSGLRGLPRARHFAELAVRTCLPGSAVRLDDRLPAAVIAAEPELSERLRSQVLGPVLTLDPEERDVLLDTLTAWLDSDGMATRASLRLGCHRNTVLNRMRRLEQLTGRQLSRPRELIELALALDAHQQRSHRPPPGFPVL